MSWWTSRDCRWSPPCMCVFIEFMPIGQSRFEGKSPLLVPEIQERISVLGKLIAVERTEMDGPAHR